MARIVVACFWVITLGLCIVAVVLGTMSQPGGPPAYELLPLLPGVMAFGTSGGLVVWRRPRMAAGWLLMAVGLTWALGWMVIAYVGHAMVVGPERLLAVGGAAWVFNWIWILSFAALGFFFLLFPDGRLPGPRWRVVGWVAAISGGVTFAGRAFTPGPLAETPSISNPFGVDGVAWFLRPAEAAADRLGTATTIAMTLSLFVRFRRADGIQRRQLLWMALAGVVFLAVNALADTLRLLDVGIDRGPFRIASFFGVPIAAGIAILRYRLFDIDRVLSKAVVYGVLAIFVTAAYMAVVLGLGAFLGTEGPSNLLLSIVATALVAVAFQPARERIQRVADRVVYGQRATPYEVLAAFSRQWGGPFTTGAFLPEMTRIVAEGTGAEQATVWRATGNELKPVAVWPTHSVEPQQLHLTDGEPPPGIVPIRHQGQLLGALSVTMPTDLELTPIEQKLLSDLAAQAALAMRNAWLIEELKASRQRIVAAQDAERRRLERDIHDGAQQRLVSLSLALRMARTKPGVTPRLSAALDDAARHLNEGLVEMRELARGIHPAILTDEGLGPALAGLAERSAIATKVASVPAARLPGSVETTAYQVASHALAAAARAGATRASIRAEHGAGRLIVEVSADAPYSTEISRQLPAIDDRVAALDGLLAVDTSADRGGVVRAVIPCESY
jgi:signal transduction histidine kinase